MKISIVIPAYNEERLLAETLKHVRQSCAAFEQRGWASEIIVCDNNSTDATGTIAREGGARVVFEPENQIARARNAGAAAAEGEWLIFIDADSHPSAALFNDVADQMVSGRTLAGGVVIRLRTSDFIGWLFNSVWNLISRGGTWLAGSFIFVETRVFRDLEGFSEQLYAGEEVEFAERLKSYAKEDGRSIKILRRHPLVTSGRKLELYGRREMAWFFLRAFFGRRRVLENRDACHPWYDGRR